MRVFFIIASSLLIYNVSFSQEFQAKAIYMSKTKLHFDFGNRKIPEDAKKKMQERMDQALQKTYVLNFNKTASLYMELPTIENSDQNRGRAAMFASMFGGPSIGESYKNIATKESKRAVEFFGKNFLVQGPLQAFQWKLEKQIKKIGKYTCFKATTSIAKKQHPFSKVKDSTTTKTTVVVWYSPEIPVSLGPDKYWGLPGLILSVQAGDTQILCTQLVLNLKEKTEIKAPKKGKKLTELEFEEIVEKKTIEIKQRFKQGRGADAKRAKN